MHKRKTISVVIAALALYAMMFAVFSTCSVTVLGKQDAPSGLVINEVMADNDGAVPGPHDTYPDWIELYNGGNQTIKLSGMYLTNNLSDPKAWAFPKNTSIESKGYLVIWADNFGGEGLHASFALNANVESLGLFDSDGKTLLDSIVLGKQLRDVSYGRIPDGGSDWQYMTVSTPGSANQADVPNPLPAVWLVVVGVFIVAVTIVGVIAVNTLASRRSKTDGAKQ
jgi:hypothetical protein